MVNLIPTPRGHATARLILLAVLSVVTLVTVAELERTDIVKVSVKRFSDAGLNRYTLSTVSLPLVGDAKDQVTTFGVIARLDLSPTSSAMLRIRPDDCIESITINGGDPLNVSSEAERWRCWPHTYLLDGSTFMQPGENTITLTIENAGGPYGIDITTVYSQPAVIVMVTASWLLLYALLRTVSDQFMRRSMVAGDELFRTLGRSYLTLLGLLLTIATVANWKGEVSLSNRMIVSILAFIIVAVMLLRCLDKLWGRPVPLRPSVMWTALSMACFAYSSVLLSDGMSPLWVRALSLLGVMGSCFAVTPVWPVLQRARRVPHAVGAMMIAALAPHAYWNLNLPAWGLLSGATVAMVRGVLWAVGLPTATLTREKLGDDGQLIDYHAFISSAEFSVKIGSWCSGFEGVALFLFLLSLFVLLDWPLFSKVRHLWAVYLLTVLFVLAVNVLRIAGLFIYAVWNVQEHGRTHATRVTIEAFHSNIGWLIYSAAFAVFLPLVYRWARRAAKVS